MFKQCLEIYEILDSAHASGQAVGQLFSGRGARHVETRRLAGSRGSTDLIRIKIEGSHGRISGGDAPTLGITGRLGGLGARPAEIGFVSDGDGALTALAAALKLVDMAKAGDRLPGDVIVSTHICPDAPTIDHHPVRLMDSPVETAHINEFEVEEAVDALLSIDTSKGNRIINHQGFAITCTVKEGYILRVSEDLLDLMTQVTGSAPAVMPISTQDITPYGNGVYHVNSILQPAVVTDAPVVGVAITTELPVAGCATGATHLTSVDLAGRFAIETAKSFTSGRCRFYDPHEFSKLQELYGSLKQFQLQASDK